MAEEPEEVLPQERIAAALGVVKVRGDQPIEISAVLASITAGIAKITMNDTTTSAQTKIGMRLSDMPGVRSLNAVVIVDTATASDATSVNVISCAHTSARFVGV